MGQHLDFSLIIDTRIAKFTNHLPEIGFYGTLSIWCRYINLILNIKKII